MINEKTSPMAGRVLEQVLIRMVKAGNANRIKLIDLTSDQITKILKS